MQNLWHEWAPPSWTSGGAPGKFGGSWHGIGLGRPPGFLHSGLVFLSLFPGGLLLLLIQAMSCKSMFGFIFSLHNPRNRKSCQSQLPSHQPKWVLNPSTEMMSGVFLYIVVSFSQILSQGLFPSQGQGRQGPFVSAKVACWPRTPRLGQRLPCSCWQPISKQPGRRKRARTSMLPHS